MPRLVKAAILVRKLTVSWTSAPTGAVEDAGAGGRGWGAVTETWEVLLRDGVIVHNKTHSTWYLSRTI